MAVVVAWHLTFNTYGSWLPGDERGYINRKGATLRERILPGDPGLHEHHSKKLKHSPVTLNAVARRTVREAIEGYCEFKGWRLYGLNVRTNHVHVVVAAKLDAGRMLNAIKARATRLLREGGVFESDRPVWSERGNKSPLESKEAVLSSIDYVLKKQGPDLPEH